MTNSNAVQITQADLSGYVHSIIRQMSQDNWRPDYVVGLTRGGLTPAVMISQYLSVPMHTLQVSLRDSELGPESNLWMAEDAFGYRNYDPMASGNGRKRILVVDDINDSGATLNWIKEDWSSSCLPSSPDWNDVWNKNVRFATIVNNTASSFNDVDYAGLEINKIEDPRWIVFPWEQWWE